MPETDGADFLSMNRLLGYSTDSPVAKMKGECIFQAWTRPSKFCIEMGLSRFTFGKHVYQILVSLDGVWNLGFLLEFKESVLISLKVLFDIRRGVTNFMQDQSNGGAERQALGCQASGVVRN
jgi:hypothetical protein